MRIAKLLWNEVANEYLYNVAVNLKKGVLATDTYIGCVDYADGSFLDVYYDGQEFVGREYDAECNPL